MKKLFVFGMVLTVISFFGCEIEDNFNSNFNFDEKTFLSNWEAWNKQNILNYSFILHRNSNMLGNNFSLIDNTTPLLNLATPLEMATPYSIKVIVKNGIMVSFEEVSNPSGEGGLTPGFTSISIMYQNLYDGIQDSKKLFIEGGHDFTKSVTIHIGYSDIHYITHYSRAYEYKPGYELAANGTVYGISDFQIVELSEPLI